MSLLNKKVLFKKRLGGTFLFVIADFSTQEVYEIYFQFSLKDPWWLPRYDPAFGELKTPLYGWLFFCFGRNCEGVIVLAAAGEKPTVERPVYDRNGQLWYVYRFNDKQMARDFHRIIKKYKTCVSVKVMDEKCTVVNQIIRRKIFGL